MFQGEVRRNVFPSEATTTLEIRAVPGEDNTKFKAMPEQVINDPAAGPAYSGCQVLQ